MVRPLAPLLRGEGWGEGLLPRILGAILSSVPRPSPDHFVIDLSP
jgi:hypothetical protein